MVPWVQQNALLAGGVIDDCRAEFPSVADIDNERPDRIGSIINSEGEGHGRELKQGRKVCKRLICECKGTGGKIGY
jgi:hypothetical protein